MSSAVKLDLLDMIERYRAYGWRESVICRKWGICPKTLHGVGGCRSLGKSPRRCAINAITPAEKAQVIDYALKHTELNHREMAYRMIDEDIAYMSPSSVYRILRDNNLLSRKEPKPGPIGWATHQGLASADDIWQTDLMIVRYKHQDYFLLSYIDVYSRFIPHYELLTSMTGDSVKEATRKYLSACERVPLNIQSDNGSCYISQEYRSYLSKLDINHRRIHPYCPNENAEIERYHRTLRELIVPENADDFEQLMELIKEQIDYYNHTRYHSGIGFVTPYAKYSGKAEKILREREQKLIKAREIRKQKNLAKLNAKAA